MVTLKTTAVLLILMLCSSVFAAINVSVDKTQITDSETLKLIIKADIVGNSSQIDTTPLEQAFNIVERSSSSAFSNINGKISNSISLHLILEPKRAGMLRIPIFKLGNSQSKPINIKVSRAAQQDFSQNFIFVTASVNNTAPMVQQQLIYTMNLYSQVDFSNANVNLDFQPKMADAIIRPLSHQKKFKQLQFSGKLLWHNAFKFAIYPQKIGVLMIPKFKQNIRVNNKGKNITLLLFAKPITLNVRLPDKNYPANEHWLPANKLNLSAKFSDKNLSFRVGEAITRKITLKAEAQTAIQLPELKLAASNGFEQYLDEQKESDKRTKNMIIGSVEQSVLIVPSKAGKQILPSVSVSWFDTTIQKTKIATLPALEIEVESTKNMQIASPHLLAKTKNQPLSPLNNNWIIATFIFAGLWILTLLLFIFRAKKATYNTKKSQSLDTKSERKHLALIKKYAKQNNAQQTKQMLAKWLLFKYGNENVEAFASQIKNQDFDKVLAELQQHLYQQQQQKWSGTQFWQVFSALSKQKIMATKQPVVPNLYPNSKEK